MKKLFKSLKDKATAAVITAKTTIAAKKAEGYVDSGVKILIAVVIGALLLAGLYALFNNVIMPSTESKVTDLFSYSGT